MSATVHNLQEKLVKFLSDGLLKKERQMCIGIELDFCQAGARPENMKEWSREHDFGYFEISYIETFASEIVEMCEERSDLFRATECIYKLRMVQFAGGRPAYTFLVRPSAVEGEEGAGTMGDLPASSTGVLAMVMRNNEFVMRQNRDMTSGSLNVLASQIKELREENKELRAERARLVAERNADRAAEADRELAVLRQAGSEQRKDKIVGKAVDLLPVVASRFLTSGGGKNGESGGGAASAAALTTVLEQLSESLTPQQTGQLGMLLNLEQRVLFGEMIRLAKAAKAPPATTAATASATTASATVATEVKAEPVNGHKSSTPAT